MTRIISKQPRKQRKSRFTAPNHVRGRFLRAPLSLALREEYKKRNMRVIKGDTVKLYRGNHKGTEGLVDEVDMRALKIIVHGVL